MVLNSYLKEGLFIHFKNRPPADDLESSKLYGIDIDAHKNTKKGQFASKTIMEIKALNLCG